MKVYVEYSSGETGIHKHKSFSALKKIYKENPSELVVSFDKDTLRHHNCKMVITIDDADILFAEA